MSVKHTNNLIHETSPYLLQHAHNPVQWHPWNEETLQKAKKLDKPIFLSIGYSSCHWCHVMEKESFENEEIADILNKNFINIKVDSSQWLIEAEKLTGEMIKKFWDEKDGGFYFTSSLHQKLIVRKKPVFDGSLPSGNSMAAYALLRLSKLFENQEYREKAEKILAVLNNNMHINPIALASLLKAADLYVYQPDEIALVAWYSHDDLKNMLKAVNSQFIPNRVIVVLDNESHDSLLIKEKIPLMKKKQRFQEKQQHMCAGKIPAHNR